MSDNFLENLPANLPADLPADLKSLNSADLSKVLKPFYDALYDQLSSSQKEHITFEQVVNGSYKLLHSYSAKPVTMKATSLTTPILVEKAGVSDCIMAVGMVVADVLAIIFQMLGINEAESRAAARAILEELGQDTIRGIQATLHDLNAASSIMDKAKLMWKIFSEIYNAVGISGILKALKDSMHWYDWIITGVTVAAQLTAWFATDGVALIAELALEGAYIAQFTEDVIKANTACST